MRKIVQDENQIVLRHVPITYWVLGVLGTAFFGSGLIGFLYYTVYHPHDVFNSLDGSWAGKIMAVIVFTVFVAFLVAATWAFISFLLSPVTTTRVDRPTRSVEMTRRSFIRKDVDRYQAAQIKGFEVDSRQVRHAEVHFTCLILKNDQKLEVEAQSSTIEDAQETVGLLNSFL